MMKINMRMVIVAIMMKIIMMVMMIVIMIMMIKMMIKTMVMKMSGLPRISAPSSRHPDQHKVFFLPP